jgi:stage II sporulation protein E
VAAVRILERFLRAGVDPAVAMKILNSMMLLKNGEEWGFATVDLMSIDLFSGETYFYKYGAAPSYVKSGKTVRRVRSENLAAGLVVGEGDGPDIIKMRLKPGSVAIVANDGVIAETNDEWLREILNECDGTDAKNLARQALQTAYTRYGAGDDMTVLAVKLEKRV